MLGTREIKPDRDDFFRAVIEERKKLPKSHPHYLLLKIIANALYGIFAELNKNEFGKNRAKRLAIFSGEYQDEETTCVVESPGQFQFPGCRIDYGWGSPNAGDLGETNHKRGRNIPSY
jgi:hypothetical protein